MYAYRCELCGTTSPQVITRAQLAHERTTHRRLFHGGHVPDGEQVLEPERFNVFDIPLGQWIVGSLMIVTIVVLIAFRHL
jgi:hypothetical protein